MHIDNITAVILALPALFILVTWIIMKKSDAITTECNVIMLVVLMLSNLVVGVIYFTTYAVSVGINF